LITTRWQKNQSKIKIKDDLIYSIHNSFHLIVDLQDSFTRKIIQTYIFEDHKNDEVRISSGLEKGKENLQNHLKIKKEDLPLTKVFGKKYEKYENEITKAIHNHYLFKSKLNMHTQNNFLITNVEKLQKIFMKNQ